MPVTELAAEGLHGRWRDVIRDADGRIIHQSEVRPNAIVADCRRMLASFVGGASAAGMQGMQFGSGLAAWDINGPPPATPAQTALVDPHPYLVPAANLQISFLDDMGAVVAAPTHRLQIVASLGPSKPPWPDGNHIAGSLREFGLVGKLGGTTALFNYVTHPVINKDPASTLERTLWLVF